jgi:hypothetical protein
MRLQTIEPRGGLMVAASELVEAWASSSAIGSARQANVI